MSNQGDVRQKTLGRKLLKFLSVYLYRTPVAFIFSHKDSGNGGFSGAGYTDQRNEGVGRDFYIYRMQDLPAFFIGKAEIFYGNVQLFRFQNFTSFFRLR